MPKSRLDTIKAFLEIKTNEELAEPSNENKLKYKAVRLRERINEK